MKKVMKKTKKLISIAKEYEPKPSKHQKELCRPRKPSQELKDNSATPPHQHITSVAVRCQIQHHVFLLPMHLPKCSFIVLF
jgi:hypothetical protein